MTCITTTYPIYLQSTCPCICVLCSMLQVAAVCCCCCCTSADPSAQPPPGILCVHVSLVKENTVSHWQGLQTHHSVVHSVCLSSVEMTVPLLLLLLLFLLPTTPKHCCFLLMSPWRCKQRSIFSTGADSLRCGVSVHQVCWSNCRLRKADHKILLAMTLKMIELKRSTTQQL